MAQPTTLDEAQDAFEAAPSARTAAEYLEQVMTYYNDDMIGDDTFLNAITNVQLFLLELADRPLNHQTTPSPME